MSDIASKAPKDLSYYIQQDINNIRKEFIGLEKNLTAKVDNIETKVDSQSETLGEILGLLKGEDKYHKGKKGVIEVTDWVASEQENIVLQPKHRQNTLNRMIDYYWAFSILAGALGVGSIASVITFILLLRELLS